MRILLVISLFLIPYILQGKSIREESELDSILVKCINIYITQNRDYAERSMNRKGFFINVDKLPPHNYPLLEKIDSLKVQYVYMTEYRYKKDFLKSKEVDVLSLDSLVLKDNILHIVLKNGNYRYENQRYVEQGINDYAKFRFEYNCDTEMWDLISSGFTRYPKLYKIKNIEEKQSYNIIYAQRNDSLFKIITPKIGTNDLSASSERIEKDKKYNLDLYPVFPTGPKGEKQVLIYDNDRIKTGKKYHNRIYKANNIDGLYLIDKK